MMMRVREMAVEILLETVMERFGLKAEGKMRKLAACQFNPCW